MFPLFRYRNNGNYADPDIISIVQSKAGMPLQLPLLEDAGEALKDYILYGRPESNSPEIFLRAVAPVESVMQVLGHSHINSAKPYMMLNTPEMKSCALDFSNIAVKRGELL